MTPSASKSRLIPLGILLLVVLAIIEWRPWHRWDNAAAAVAVIPAPAKNADLVDQTEQQPIRAQLSPVRYTTIAAELAGRVQEVPFREGESFKERQSLIVFDCATQKAQFDKVKAAMAIAERNYQTNKKLLALGSVGRIEYENSASEYQKARADTDELSAIVAKCTIVAPFDGRIVEQKIRAQQFVQSGQPLLEILDHSALELEFIAPSKWSAWLVPGYRFTLRVDETGKSYPAKITRVGARIDSISQTVKLAAVIDGDYPDLSPGMSGTLDITPPSGQ